ncbi:unnamed protein product [Peniophora sp. CBMAI 1063]|nr:unnamed protein product [Peniophora sp. CBMAI 1063]
MRELEALFVSTKDILSVSVNHVSIPTTSTDYDEAFEDGQRTGYADGYEDGRRAFWKEQGTETWRSAAVGAARSCPEILQEVTRDIRAMHTPVDRAVQTIATSTANTSSQTTSPAATTDTSSQTDPSAIRSSCAVQVGTSDDPPVINSHDIPVTPSNHPLRDLSILRSDDNIRPFGTLQRRSRRVRPPRSHTPRSRHCSSNSPYTSPSTSTPSVLAWDSDPRLIKLSRALRSLGWTRGRGEDAARVLVGAGRP